MTLSFCPTRANVADLPALVDVAAEVGAAGLHLMWHVAAGRGRDADQPEVPALFAAVVAAADRAAVAGRDIDNLTALRTQVFAPVGTRHDGTTSGCQSVAVGPDDRLYPSPALVGVPELATSLAAGLEAAWRESPVLDRCAHEPGGWCFALVSCFLAAGTRNTAIARRQLRGRRSTASLLERLAAWIIDREHCRARSPTGRPGLLLKMGETHESCHATVIWPCPTHCMLSLAKPRRLAQIKAILPAAAKVDKGDIVIRCSIRPICRTHSETFRVRGYGCGSPIADAGADSGWTWWNRAAGRGSSA